MRIRTDRAERAVVGYLRDMDRVPNEVVWAGVASIACGAVLASVLGGTRAPWLLVAIVVALGFAITTVRRRRERARHERYRREQEPDLELRAATQPRNPRNVVPDSGATRSLAPGPAVVRRAGARSESLGAKPRRDQEPPR